jgi:hypothetical protein
VIKSNIFVIQKYIE